MLSLGFVHLGICDDDNQIIGINEARRCAVDADGARASLGFNCIGREARAISDVKNGHLLVWQNVGRLHECGVDGDRSFVMQIAFRYGSPVNLGLEKSE